MGPENLYYDRGYTLSQHRTLHVSTGLTYFILKIVVSCLFFAEYAITHYV